MTTSSRHSNFRRGWPLAALLLGAAACQPLALRAADTPNFIVIFCDDLGYGDLACFGHPSIRTPHLDRMAAEGMRFTEFYCAAPVCTPSRAALLTGRYPVRSGMCSDTRRVLFPDSAGGLPAEEVTLAEALRDRGYATGIFGKWHLGHLPQYRPMRHGFDYWFGLPYSNDMDYTGRGPRGAVRSMDPDHTWWNVPLMRNDDVLEQPANQNTLTRRYTYEAIDFIKRNRTKPFFVYLPHSMPHVPLFRSASFANRSLRGLYGDVIEEIDWSVGMILEVLGKEDLAENTLVFFTSDNGPWLPMGLTGGSAGLLRGGKGSTWEGGMRVPGIAWWPGTIKSGQVTQNMASTLDLFPTFMRLAGGALPPNRIMDGHDLTPLLTGSGLGQRQTYFYYRGTELFAVRHGPFKAHFQTRAGYGQAQAEKHDPPLLFHLRHDPSEQHNVAGDHPGVLQDIANLVQQHRDNLKPGTPQLEERIAAN